MTRDERLRLEMAATSVRGHERPFPRSYRGSRGAHDGEHRGGRAMTRDEALNLDRAATPAHGHNWTSRGAPAADKLERTHPTTAFRSDDFRAEFIALCCGIVLLATICGGFAAVAYFLIG